MIDIKTFLLNIMLNIMLNFLSNRLEDCWRLLNNYLTMCGYYLQLLSKEITYQELFGNGLTNTITLSDGTGANPLIFYQAANLFKPKKRKHLWEHIVEQATNYQKNWDEGNCRMFDRHSGFEVEEKYLEYFKMLWDDLSHKEKVKLHKIHLLATNIDNYERLIKEREKLEKFIDVYDKTKFFRNNVKKAKKLLERINLLTEKKQKDAELALITKCVFNSFYKILDK